MKRREKMAEILSDIKKIKCIRYFSNASYPCMLKRIKEKM